MTSTKTITTTTVSNPAYQYALVYLGAPYGDNEGGHIRSLHATENGAEQAWWKMGELASREHAIVRLDDTRAGPRWVFSDVKTPREYFLLA